ncbi:MAG: winged helix-turn-helix domain-containing protein, partial [Candidatus Hydrogenedentes bacterium]|nr:winged helix-turn-helix domain-containing protein [Candidatus Hydrogenedentota bacterium]
DRREYDADLESGNFSIAVVVYEKLSQLLVRRPERLAEIDLVIADELELLSDQERGAMAELLLTRILRGGCRLIGLTAVIGQADKLAAWMQAELLRYERRPVELRYGVLHEGRFRYRTYNEFGEGTEEMADGGSESPHEVLAENVGLLAERGETCLIFVKAKHESRRGAEMLAARLNLPAADETLAALAALDATRSRESLQQTLQCGVAFHNADLSPEERRLVEEGFRKGEVRVLVSTSTLAVGLNLPAQNVFLNADKWRFDARLGMPWKTPILRNEYENMGGRAGRYGNGHAFGRSILIAVTPFDEETLWRRYVEGEREEITPRLAKESLDNHVLRLVASRTCTTPDELCTFLDATLSGQWVWAETLSLDEVAARVRAALNRAVDAGVLSQDPEGRLEATPLGVAVAAKGVTIATARALEQWISETETREWPDIDLLYAVMGTEDGRMLQVSMTTREYDEADYAGRMKRLTREEPSVADTLLNRVRNSSVPPLFEEMRALKVALFLQDWMNQEPMSELEEIYDTMAGQILGAADQAGWLIDATAAIATALGARQEFIDRLQGLAQRVQFGVQEELLPLCLDLRRDLGVALLRRELLSLAAEGLGTAEALKEVPLQILTRHVSETAAKAMKQWSRSLCSARPLAVEPVKEQRPILLIDESRPNQVVLEGVQISLQDKQYRLIALLAGHAGACVDYETIYQALWGDVVVENSQMYFQKKKLLLAITAACPHHGELISTIPKRGFMLQLPPEAVLIKRRANAA